MIDAEKEPITGTITSTDRNARVERTTLGTSYRSIGNYRLVAGASAEDAVWNVYDPSSVIISTMAYTLRYSETYSNFAEEQRKPRRNKLLQFAGKWKGDDFEQCINEVYNSRSKIEFD